MTRQQMLLALTKYELQWVMDNPEHTQGVSEFFADGGFTQLTDAELIEKCKANVWIEGETK